MELQYTAYTLALLAALVLAWGLRSRGIGGRAASNSRASAYTCRLAVDRVQPTAGLIGLPGVDSALIPAVFPLYRADRRSHDGVYVAPRWSRRVTHAPTARAGALLSRCTGRVKRRDPTSRARLRRLDDEHRRLDSASGLESGDRGHGLLVIVSSGPWQFRGVERWVRRTPTARR
jgi:hypothetical protein